MSFLISDGYKKRTLELDERDRFDYWRDIICDEFVKLDCEKMKTGNFVGELRGGVGVSGLRFSGVMSKDRKFYRHVTAGRVEKARIEPFSVGNGVVFAGFPVIESAIAVAGGFMQGNIG
jgi:hypothetical protein